MLFSRRLSIDSALPVGLTRARVRGFATSRELPELEAMRRRQIIGWRLSETHEDFVFQPEYGDSLDIDGARFVGLVEPNGSGSRIRGRIVLSPLTRVIMSVWVLAVLGAAFAAVRQGQEPVGNVVAIALVMLGGAAWMVRYSLRSTSRLVEARLRQSLDVSERRVA
jgi:hypothetical protein